ncbi:hypothetical protein GCG54_00011355 [Colletotrichum gloeosporioides]|uniref:F-box domain-containing protein n=1 Tax=Colletotrichum gloeosporioides TaxID=474922 RepID=A0A8H4CSF9_COLGL|nr:uncharacterized protein GCG54_00011355 [Colletotrichum gloeosporioides]KAF3809159.1 hypothetical protein GCG54_00011355 [Colletotrichum gloeosporioides]
MTYITNPLGLHDIFNLALTCRQFSYLITNDDISELRVIRSSKQYARGFRRLVKIRDAIATATPYSVAVVACANDFIYCNGMLCYTVGPERLRILDLHNSGSVEMVIDTAALLRSVPDENLGNNSYKFRPIHYAEGIVSCLYTPPKIEGRSRLLVLNLHERKLLTCHRLESHQKLFVRNTQNYLYYGTHSFVGDDGFKRWVLKQFSIRDQQWGSGHLDLEDIVGSDIGATVCFEIIDDYFYGLSSLSSFDVYETDWTSYYLGFRFPVGSSRPRDMQLTSKKKMWRRQHQEGPIDDRWSTLSLEKDPVGGNLMAVECRREYLVGDCSSTRTSYRTDLNFGGSDDSDSDQSDYEYDADEMEHPSDSTSAAAKTTPSRDPSTVHRGDDGSTIPAATFTHCFIRSYHPSCETFMDLINDPAASETMIQRPQIRSISRSMPAGRQQSSDKASEVSCWPQSLGTEKRGSSCEALGNILNPRGKQFHGPISGAMDDRSIVYAVGQPSHHSTRPLVFISFDPSIRLGGLTCWPGGPTGPPLVLQKPRSCEASSMGCYPTPQSMPDSAPTSRNASFSEGCMSDKKEAAWGSITPAMYSDSLRNIGTPTGFNFAYCGDH